MKNNVLHNLSLKKLNALIDFLELENIEKKWLYRDDVCDCFNDILELVKDLENDNIIVNIEFIK